MAANILHFGQELGDYFPPLRKAGYSINRYEKIFEFRQVLQSGIGHDAISLSDRHDDISLLVVLAARTYSPAPLILFRTEKVIPFPAGDKLPSRMDENTKSDFDLVVPGAASPYTWISHIDKLIARNRAILDESRRLRDTFFLLRRESAMICRESAEVMAKSQFDRKRAELELVRNASTATSSTPLVDRPLTCSVCGAAFVFSAGEQLFFRSRNFVNDPKRCKTCRFTRRPEIAVTCADCGTSTTVPFKPVQGRPVLCRFCFEKTQTAV